MFMPGSSHSGPLPPITPLELALAANLKKHVVMLAETIGPRHTRRPAALEAAAGYIEEQFRSFGLTPTAQEFVADGVTVRNIEVEIRGSTKLNEIVVIGGHYDSVPNCPAANDNGSGVAAALELARLAAAAASPLAKGGPQGGGLAGGPTPSDSPLERGSEIAGNPFRRRPERTLRFVAFVNEEPPFFHTELMGSLVCARRYKARNENVVGMISLETIGCYSDAPGSQKLPLPPPLDKLFPSVGNFIAFVSDLGALRFVQRWVGAFRRLAKFPSEGISAPALITGVDWSDHWSFRECGYPALMVTDTAPFRFAHYHLASDTPDTIDFERTARVTAGIGAVTAEEVGGGVIAGR